ncbi:MAG: hypothetical protein ABI456_24595 [Ktedonobacteraceae bacterium]|nr:hypothetical protein [Chloroflexota bacterium]
MLPTFLPGFIDSPICCRPDQLPLWGGITTICALFLFIDAGLLFRKLFMTRQSPWSYLLIVLPLGVSAWSFLVGREALETATTWQRVVTIRSIPPTVVDVLLARTQMAINDCLLLTLISLLVFILLFRAEIQMFPRVDRRPVWVVMRGRRGFPRL